MVQINSYLPASSERLQCLDGSVDKHDILHQLYGVNRKKQKKMVAQVSLLVCLTRLLSMPVLCTRKPVKEVHHCWTFIGS